MPQSLTTLCGSLYYAAPELLKNHPYDETADNWSCGVILYFLLSGHLPFTGQDQQELFNNIRLGRYSFDDKYWCGISEEAVTLIKHLLDVDPSNRYTATQALQTDWINNADDAALGRRSLCRSRSSIAEQSSVKDVMRAAHWESYRRMSSLSDV
jgi:serine/threonine protein kinase